ncbi:MAG: TlpA family protein disulfide reductase [Deltaproteobacteria bacterium]|nr:TlpA family protein disulfide reductase [Deltaproteobacteria bacterium]
MAKLSPFFFVCVLIVLSLPAYAVDRKYFDGAGLQRLNEEPPHFTLSGGSGKEVSLEDFKGKVVILHFWATWCKPCRVEFPLLERLWQEIKGKDVILLPISIDENAKREGVEAFAKTLGASFPVYLAREGDITPRYWTWGVPETYLIDRKGRVQARAVGAKDWGEKGIRELINALLEER